MSVPVPIMPATELGRKCAKLRQKLKDWENAFAASNDGRKPSREDVKKQPDIAQRYKDYNKLRDADSESQSLRITPPSRRKHPHPAENKPTTASAHSPSKRQKTCHSHHPSVIDPYDPPLCHLMSPSRQRAGIGPTPQKDGHILGLFDGLSSRSKSMTPPKRDALRLLAANVQTTPSKKPAVESESVVEVSQSERGSASKRDMLKLKTTPSMQRTTRSFTPGSRDSVSKLGFDDTPAFLRRDSQRAFASEVESNDVHDSSWSPITVRKVSKPAGRTLSAIVSGLRDMEDEKLDEELKMLREMEGRASPVHCKPPKLRLLVEDSQGLEMPLGPDGGLEIIDDTENVTNEGNGENGKTPKVWKKKGQKRTTRRVNMRPNVAKWMPEPMWKVGSCEDRVEGEGDAKSGTEITISRVVESGENHADGCLDEQTINSDEASGEEAQKTIRQFEQQETRRKTLPPTKAKKKISATAHANFRALKIKNKHSRAKGAGRRFGKRR